METLQQSKGKNLEISTRVVESETTEKSINMARKKYLQVGIVIKTNRIDFLASASAVIILGWYGEVTVNFVRFYSLFLLILLLLAVEKSCQQQARMKIRLATAA